jgi:hypothetical protein
MITTGKVQYDVTLSWKAYEHLGNKGRSQLRKEHGFKDRTFKTREEAEQFAQVERERTGLEIRVQECTPIYGIL